MPDERLVDLRGVDRVRPRRRPCRDRSRLHVVLPGRAALRRHRVRAREPDRPGHVGARAEVAAEEQAAHARDRGAQHHRRRRDVGPAQQRNLALRASVPAGEEAADHAAVRHQTAAIDAEDLGEAVKVAEVREHVKDARADDRPDRGPHVDRGRRLLPDAVLLREAHHQKPADHQRRPQHHAVGVDRHGRPGVLKPGQAGNQRVGLEPDQDLRARSAGRAASS